MQRFAALSLAGDRECTRLSVDSPWKYYPDPPPFTKFVALGKSPALAWVQ